MEEDKTVLLFRQIQAATKNGHDAEVRRDKMEILWFIP